MTSFYAPAADRAPSDPAEAVAFLGEKLDAERRLRQWLVDPPAPDAPSAAHAAAERVWRELVQRLRRPIR